MDFFKNKENILVLAIVALVLFFSLGKEKLEQPQVQALMEVQSENAEAEVSLIMIHITGRIKAPGVVRLPANARLLDAVEAAGGLQPDADSERINLSMKLKDEDRIHIPAIGEESDIIPVGVSTEKGQVDLNHATQAELESLPGIGPALSKRILDYRESTPFTAIEDIKNVSGIGDKLFEGMKEYITVR